MKIFKELSPSDPQTMQRATNPLRALARKVQAPVSRVVVAGQRSFFGGADDVHADPKDLVLTPSMSSLRPRQHASTGRYVATEQQRLSVMSMLLAACCCRRSLLSVYIGRVGSSRTLLLWQSRAWEGAAAVLWEDSCLQGDAWEGDWSMVCVGCRRHLGFSCGDLCRLPGSSQLQGQVSLACALVLEAEAA